MGSKGCPYIHETILQNNYKQNTVYADKLHQKAVKSVSCTDKYCVGSFLLKGKPAFYTKTKENKIDESIQFINEYYESIKKLNSDEHKNRITEIVESIEKTDFYELTYKEIEFGTRLAWRNAARCPGRIFYPKLELIDARDVTTEEEMFDHLCKLLKYVAADKANIKSALVIFPQRKALDKDFRIWNSQLITYAGYRIDENTYIGDKAQIEFTQACEKLGWKGKGTDFDVLPLVLQANGGDPKWFELPKELILEVPLSHPNYDFASLNLKYFAVVSFSTFMFDIGGCQFTAAPFTAYYSAPEISRALADSNRYDKLKLFAEKMNLDTGSNISLWKDRTIIEINYCLLYSFKLHQVAITDHHTISEQFKKFFEYEVKERGGCPADWVWVNPQYSTHLEDSFHIEMINYKLLPSIEYQMAGWKYLNLIKRMRNSETKVKYIGKFKSSVYSVIMINSLMRKTMDKRIKCTVLYATETKTSEEFANSLSNVFNYSYNTKVMCMEDYDIEQLCKENFLIIVASTTGNGDPPENGKSFKNDLLKIKKSINRYSVFALGSSLFPNFCSFGKLMDKLLYEIGAERINSIGFGDDISDQKKSFNIWSFQSFKNSTVKFSIDFSKLNFPDDHFPDVCETYRLSPISNIEKYQFINSLKKWHKRTLIECSVKNKLNLQHVSSGRKSLFVQLEPNIKQVDYKPGDHVGIIPSNSKNLVDAILNRVKTIYDHNEPLKVECKRVSSGKWVDEETYPIMSLRDALTNFLDITTPLKQSTIEKLIDKATNQEEKKRLEELAYNESVYEEWKNFKYPNLAEFLEEFSSIVLDDLFLIIQLNKLQPRYYSISSSPLNGTNLIELTLGVIEYKTSKGDMHYGVCTKWLDNIDLNSSNQIVPLFIKEAPNFHLPNDNSNPIIMIGAGTGIAPFRSFWLNRKEEMAINKSVNFGEMHLYFGCRNSTHDDLYKNELNCLLEEKSLTSEYVQDLIEADAEKIFDLVFNKSAHVYICGNIDMADAVKNVLNKIISKYDQNIIQEDEDFIQMLKNENRFHEDIYSILVPKKQ